MELEKIFCSKMKNYREKIKYLGIYEVSIDNTIYNTRFFPDFFKKRIKKTWLKKYIIQNNYVNIYTNDRNFDLDDILKIISIFYYLFKDNYKWEKQDFYLFPFNTRKRIDDNCIKEININSAVTTIYFNEVAGPIIIYRKEEMEKVLIHELLHSFHYDLHSPKYNSCVYFGSKCKNNVYSEGFVEANAQILQLLFYDYIYPKRINFIDELKKELKHSFKNSCIIYTKVGCQTTSAISYFINKYIILKDILKGNLNLYVLYNNRVPDYKIDEYNFPKYNKKDKFIRMAKFKWIKL